MKLLALLGCLLLPGAARAAGFDFNQLHINNLRYTGLSKARVVRLLGAPRTAEPRYECGEYSAEQMHQRFYELRYRQATLIGNARHGYDLASFRFAAAGPARLSYGRWQLSAATTLREFARMLGKLESSKNRDGSVEVVVRAGDVTGTFTFRAGRLSEYHYGGVGC